MSQLFATFGIDARLLLIQAVNFGVAMLVLWYFVFRPLSTVIEERRRKVAQGVTDAEAAAREREKTERERAGILSSAEHEAERVVERAVEEGKTEGRSLVKEAHSQRETILKDARAEAEEVRRKALAESEKDIARAATLMAEGLLKEH